MGVFRQSSLSPHAVLGEEVKTTEGACYSPRLGRKRVKYDDAHENRISMVRPFIPSAEKGFH